MHMIFKMSVTYKHFFNLTQDNCVRCEADFVVHNSIFYRALSDVRF